MRETVTMTATDQLRAQHLTRLVAGELDVGQTATLLGLSERQVWRLRRAFLEHGPAALVHGNRGRRSPRRVPMPCGLGSSNSLGPATTGRTTRTWPSSWRNTRA
jgi:hypothetical protein